MQDLAASATIFAEIHHKFERSECTLPSRVQCFNGSCVASKSGDVCIICGRPIRGEQLPEISFERALAILRESGQLPDSDDPNYWVHLLHDLEIVAEPVDLPTNAGLTFYGKRPKRQAG